MAAPQTLSTFAPAKINLHLRVGPPRADGFHPLRSWMVTIGLGDRLTATVRDDVSERVTLRVDGHPTLTSDSTNLVHRAAMALQPPRPIEIRLEKRVPIGAGLGGGSADAAATLVLVNELLALRHSTQQLHALAATLGSDVPFFLQAPSAIATGRGEHLEPCPPPVRAEHVLLILPPFGISTPQAYRSFDTMLPSDAVGALEPFDAAAWAQLPSEELLKKLRNDLEPPAFAIEPRLAALGSDLERRLHRTVRMSGSGSTLFTLFEDAAEAAAAAEQVNRLGTRAIATRLGQYVIRPAPMR